MNKLFEINNISCYYDETLEKDKFLLLYKQKDLINPGLIYVNTKEFNEALSKCEGSTIDPDEINKILKNQERNKENLKCVIGNSIQKEKYEKIINNILY